MNTLLIFFALPIAVIIISAILEKLLNSPIAVASFIFAIFLIVTFAAFDETFLIATLAYTILAFITALIFCLIKRRECNGDVCNVLSNLIQNNTDNSLNNEEVLDVADELTNNNSNCCYNRYRRKKV